MVDGALLVYHRPLAPWRRDASTVMEHVGAFSASRHRIWEVNTDAGFPPGLADLEFKAIILHYCLFGMNSYSLSPRWLDYLDQTKAYKIAFFQDECTRCQRRFQFLNDHEVDCVYTCLEPSEFEKVYGRYTGVSKLVSNVPGYVPARLGDVGRRFTIADDRRTIDVGYRGRPLPAYLGRGAMEKHEIGERFRELTRGAELRLDIATREGDRLYGDDWYRFLANCRCVLGVESGASAFDLEDEVFAEWSELARSQDEVGIEDLTTLPRWEDVVYYRTVSPRHFEAAALKVCQVLFEGKYSGALQPMVHYVPLAKDFSNVEEVVKRIQDADLRRELTENAYRDLIGSGAWSYSRMLDDLDTTLAEAGVSSRLDPASTSSAGAQLRRGTAVARRRRQLYWAFVSLLEWGPVHRLVRAVGPSAARIRRALRIPSQDAVPR